MKRFTYAVLALSLATTGEAARATVFVSAATGVSAVISAGSALKVNTVAGVASGTAGAAYNQTTTVASLAQNATLVTPSIATFGLGAYDALTTGVITAQAFSTLPGSATGTATISNLGLSAYSDLSTLLGISARTITSTTVAGIGANGLYVTGTTTLAGLGLSGVLGTLGLNLNLLANPTVNDVIYSFGGLTVTLNEQQQTRTAASLALSTNALHVTLNDYLFGDQKLSGDIVVGHSEASVANVPEPASWAMMVCGFGLLGAALRRPRPRLRLA